MIVMWCGGIVMCAGYGIVAMLLRIAQVSKVL